MYKYVYDARHFTGEGKMEQFELPEDTFVISSENEHRLCHSESTSTWYITCLTDTSVILMLSGTWIDCASSFERATGKPLHWEDAPFKWGEPIDNPTRSVSYTPFWTSDETGEEYESDDGWVFKRYKTSYRLFVSTKPFGMKDDNPDQDIKDHNNIVRFETCVYDNLVDLVKDIETYTDLTF